MLLLLGTVLFLASLLVDPLTGGGGTWVVFASEANDGVPTGGHDLGRAVILAKHEAIYVKWAVIKVGVYLAFGLLVLGHALLWPESPPSRLTLQEVPPPSEPPGRSAEPGAAPDPGPKAGRGR
jgi:hypothetical protein